MDIKLNISEAPLSGISLVEAGAGTGKTYNITTLYIRALLEKNLSPSQILVVTYTEAATAELKFRIRSRMHEAYTILTGTTTTTDEFLLVLLQNAQPDAAAKLKQSLNEFDQAAIFTIHGFCQRLLKEESLAFNVSPLFEILTDDSGILQDVTDAFWRKKVHELSQNREGRIFLNYLSDIGITPDSILGTIRPLIRKPYAHIYPELPPIEHYYSLFKNLSAVFADIKSLFGEEGEKLRSVFFGDILNGNIYRNNKREEYWQLLMEFLNLQILPVNTFEKLELFGSKLESSPKKGKTVPEFRITKRIDDFLELARQIKPVKTAFIKDAFTEIIKMYQQKKEDSDLITYDDLLTKVSNGLHSGFSNQIKATLQNRFPIALVDEFQDTDPVQYGIFSQIYGKGNGTALFMIGDPKQAIYSFRGADIFTYLLAKHQADPDKRYTLEYNYRSNAVLINAVNQVFSHAGQPFLIDELNFTAAKCPENPPKKPTYLFKNGKESPPLQFIDLSRHSENKGLLTEMVAESVANEIKVLLNGEYTLNETNIKKNDIAVLVRTNRQALMIQAALASENIKSVLRSRESVFASKEASELLLVMQALANPANEPVLKAALATELMGFSAAEMIALSRNQKTWNPLYQAVLELNKLWKEKGFDRFFEFLLHEFLIEERLSAFFDAERRLTNLYHLGELLKKAESANHLNISGTLRFLNSKINDTDNQNEDELIRLESDEELVQIVTMHASKGLEYPLVFCPFLWDAPAGKNKAQIIQFHHHNALCLDIGSPGEERNTNVYEAQYEEMAESVRLAYVALTRAKSACFVHYAEVAGTELSALACLAEGKETMRKRLYSKIFKSGDEPAFSIPDILEQWSKQDNILLRDSVQKDTYADFAGDSEVYEEVHPHIFSRKDLSEFPVLTSFSGLAGHGSAYETETGYDFDYDESDHKELSTVLNEFSFPKGTKSGSLLHNILEDIVFSDEGSFPEVIKKKMEFFGFDVKWQETLLNWVKKTVNHPLDKSGLQLASLHKQDVLKEMEFHFPVNGIHSGAIISLIRKNPPFADHTIPNINGFMKGFIDLVFLYQNRFYILDYKSNYLGDDFSFYGREFLKSEVENANYDVQYHIYTVALHRYLVQILPGYNYKNHFGGVIYLFLRGIDSNSPASGVFFDKPDAELIAKLDNYFKQGNGDGFSN